MTLVIIRSKPNPSGKDVSGHHPLSTQLLGEWVDVRNDGPSAVTLAGVYLANECFSGACERTKTQTYWDGSSVRYFAPGQVLRVHTGRSADQIYMHASDRLGADIHAFAESSSFILNNRCGDKIALWMKRPDGSWHPLPIDSATYDPNPPDGKVLQRMGGRLL